MTATATGGGGFVPEILQVSFHIKHKIWINLQYERGTKLVI